MTVQALTKANAGELDPLLLGQRAMEVYGQGLRNGLNCIALPHGPTARRPGNRRAGTAALTTRKTCSFVFGVGDAYTLEFLDLKMRFWRSDRTPVLDSGGNVYEIATPWTGAQARSLRWQRSGDVMWFTHPDLPVQELKRTALAPLEVFTLADADLKDGPYYPENGTAATMTTGATGTGAITVTASVATFDTTSPTSKDIGRHFRIKLGTVPNQSWAWGKITAVTSATVATVTFVTEVASAAATASWRLGLYSARTGYPSSVCIFQERLTFGSNVANSFPRIDLSTSGGFLVFKPGTDDDNGIQVVVGISVGDNGVPVIRDVVPAKVLVVITGAGALRIAASGTSSALTPLNVDISPLPTSTGGGDVAALSAQGSILYLDLQRRTLGEIRSTSEVYADALGYREISIRNGHLLRDSAIVSMAWADKPWGLIVMAREDGMFVLGTYAPTQEVIGFNPQQLAAEGNVESFNVLPTLEGNEIWMLVERAGVRTIEVSTNLLRNTQPDREAVNLDSAITVKNAPAAILSYVSVDGSGVQTWQADAAVFLAGHVGRAIRVLERGSNDRLNMPTWRQRTLRIATVPSAMTITATVEGTAPASPVASGEWLISMTELSGLDALEGRSVYLFADGAEQGPFTVTLGALTLPEEAWYVTVGLAYRSEFQPMPPNPQTRKGSAVGRRTAATTRATVVRTGGLRQVKWDGTSSGLRPLRRGTQPMDMAPALYTGDLELEALPDSDTPVAPLLVSEGAYPFCIAGLAPDYSVGETG